MSGYNTSLIGHIIKYITCVQSVTNSVEDTCSSESGSESSYSSLYWLSKGSFTKELNDLSDVDAAVCQGIQPW